MKFKGVLMQKPETDVYRLFARVTSGPQYLPGTFGPVAARSVNPCGCDDEAVFSDDHVSAAGALKSAGV